MKKTNQKRTFFLLTLMLIMAMSLGSSSAFAQLQQHSYAIVSTSQTSTPVPLRDKPDKSADVFYAYHHGTLAKVLNKTNTEWWEVTIGGVKGYMEAVYLKEMDFAEMTTELPVMNIKNKTDTGHLNLRERPSLESPIIRQYYNDEHVLLMGVSDEWYHVIGYGGRVGFMKPEFLEASGTTGQYMFTEDLLQLRPSTK